MPRATLPRVIRPSRFPESSFPALPSRRVLSAERLPLTWPGNGKHARLSFRRNARRKVVEGGWAFPTSECNSSAVSEPAKHASRKVFLQNRRFFTQALSTRAEWRSKRVGLITQRSVDRNHTPLLSGIASRVAAFRSRVAASQRCASHPHRNQSGSVAGARCKNAAPRPSETHITPSRQVAPPS